MRVLLPAAAVAGVDPLGQDLVAGMSKRQRICRDGCGAAVVLAQAPNGGWMQVEPYPDPAGRIRVDVLSSLMVLRDDEPSSDRTKRYAAHACVPADKAVPRGGRPEQMALGGAE